MAHAARFQPGETATHAARQPFHKPHTSLGATGHWVKTAGILAPLLIGEFIKDPEQKWRYVRIASVATALVSEAMWTHKIRKEREEVREHYAAEHGQAV